MQADQPKKRGPKSKADKVAEGLTVALAALPKEQESPVADAPVIPVFVAEKAPQVPVMPLDDYIKTMQQDFPPLVELTHPDATDGGFHNGIYSGFRLKKGPCQALYSDGTTK